MRESRRYRWPLFAGVLTGLLLGVAGPGEAGEECRKFLDGLRDRGYYDMALAYLEQMRTSRLADPDFKAIIDYEAGMTLKESARVGRARSVREEELDLARDMFKRFLAQHDDHPLAPGANTQLANLLVERGKILTEQAADQRTSAEDKEKLEQEARALYKEAQQVFAELEKYFKAEHGKFDKFLKDARKIEARDQVRRNLLEARISMAQVLEETAKTYDPGSAENKKHLESAAGKYQELYENYGAILAGLYAHMWEGRCYRELGQPDLAFGAFEDLLSQPNEPRPFRLLKNKTMILFLETALAQKKYQKAVAEARKWESEARGQDETSPEGLAIKYFAGEISFERSRALQKDPKKKPDATDALNQARKWLKFVADRPGDYQKQARAMLRRDEFTGGNAEIPEPANYIEARDRGQEAFDLMQDPELTANQAAQAHGEALEYYRMAIRLRPPDVEAEELNVVRYHMAYLYWLSGDAHEASVLGEFLARVYSDSLAARPGAKIAMAACAKLINEAPPDDRQFEAKRMTDIATYVTQRWPGEPEADDAWMTLIGTALNGGDLELAEKHLAGMRPESARRGDAELRIGQRLWAAYLAAARKDEAQRPQQARLDQMVGRARQRLAEGVQRVRKQVVDQQAEITYELAASVLSLAQIDVSAGNPGQAIKWLEDKDIGPLKLVEDKHPVADRGKFRVETLKAALRAYVASQEPGSLDKAQKVMQSLEEAIKQSGDPEAGSTLTRIYISLGRELQGRLKKLREQKDTQQLDKVSQGFEGFLDRISQREQGNTFSSLTWVAQTFFDLGAGFDPGLKELSPQAEKYFKKAADTYRKILELCQKNQIEAPAGAAVAIKIRMAKCLRRLAKEEKHFEAAKKVLLQVIQEKPTIVDAQREVAYTYQDWGRIRPKTYLVAIKGSPPHKVWGWGGLARRVYGRKQYDSIFHEARYNLAMCRFEYSKRQSGELRKKGLQQAEKDITAVHRQFPGMGGREWFDKYNGLLKQIQSLRGVKPAGLPVSADKETSTP